VLAYVQVGVVMPTTA